MNDNNLNQYRKEINETLAALNPALLVGPDEKKLTPKALEELKRHIFLTVSYTSGVGPKLRTRLTKNINLTLDKWMTGPV